MKSIHVKYIILKVYHTMCHVNLGAYNIEILNAVENNKELPHFTY